jgi:hypothetical protein
MKKICYLKKFNLYPNFNHPISGKKVRIQRPGTGQLLQVDLGQLEQFLDFYGKPAEAPPLKTAKVNKIIDNLINGHTVTKL